MDKSPRIGEEESLFKCKECSKTIISEEIRICETCKYRFICEECSRGNHREHATFPKSGLVPRLKRECELIGTDTNQINQLLTDMKQWASQTKGEVIDIWEQQKTYLGMLPNHFALIINKLENSLFEKQQILEQKVLTQSVLELPDQFNEDYNFIQDMVTRLEIIYENTTEENEELSQVIQNIYTKKIGVTTNLENTRLLEMKIKSAHAGFIREITGVKEYIDSSLRNLQNIFDIRFDLYIYIYIYIDTEKMT